MDSLDRSLPADLDPQRLPRHIAVIMDGNGRWAARQGLPRMAGHRQGAKTLKSVLRCCQAWGVKILTAYAFSTENWQRPLEEVQFLLRLFDRLLQQELASLQREGVRVTFMGDLSALPIALQDLIQQAIQKTARNRGIQFNVAINYGSRSELTRACRQIARQVQSGELSPESVDETAIARHLYTWDLPDPDLLIRTSGEMRLSNYLLWQLAYTELYFTGQLWPDFNALDLHQAILHYQSRDRRFGGLSPKPLPELHRAG